MTLSFTAPIQEKELREFSKSLHAKSRQDDGHLNLLNAALEAFIITAHDPEITAGHRAAATNAICSILGHLQACDECFRLPEDLWFQIFAIVIDRSDVAKGKSMRQLLGCLIDLLRSYTPNGRENIGSQALGHILAIILGRSDHGKIKAAFQILSMFLSKKAVNLKFLLMCLRDSDGGSLLDSACHSRETNLQSFVGCLFNWTRYQDSSFGAGQVIAALLLQIKEQKEELEGNLGPTVPPFWTEPLLSSVVLYPEALINLRFHVFPTLFSMNFVDYTLFLDHVGLRTAFEKSETTSARQTKEDRSTIVLLYTALQVGKEIGLIIDVPYKRHKEIEVRNKVVYIPDKFFDRLLRDIDSTVRLSGLSLVVSSHSITRPFTKGALNCLKSNFSHLFFETDANARGEVLTYIHRLLDRLKAATSLLDKGLDRKDGGIKSSKSEQSIHEDEASMTLAYHQEFLSWFWSFLRNQLHPVAAYQRHITSLRALLLLAKSGLDESIDSKYLSKQALGEIKWPFHRSIFDPCLRRVLQDLVMDPFDDVRSFATLLLEIDFASNQAQNSTRCSTMSQVASINRKYKIEGHELYTILRKAEERMLRSGRADHADGVSRIYALLFETAVVSLPESSFGNSVDQSPFWTTRMGIMKHLVELLEVTINMASTNPSLAVRRFPMHGVLASLRYLFETPDFYRRFSPNDGSNPEIWAALHKRVIVGLGAVWKNVRPILCNDAPEGHVPGHMEEEVNLTTKDILSYSWRALKEASSLLRVIVTKAPILDDTSITMFCKKSLEDLSALCFTELAELRHRGAFSAVAQAYAACCSRGHTEKEAQLLTQLYEGTLHFITNKASSTTRRSAGLPSLMTGVLGADPGGPLFVKAMSDLQAIAETAQLETTVHGDPMPQVHALNCLKAIFTSTVLGPSTDSYTVSALDLAGQCLTSKIWAIRNCGLMLFRALIDRLLGSTDSQNWSEDSEIKAPRLSYNDFPNLFDIVLKLLKPETTELESAGSVLESVFPALKILQRIPPPKNQGNEIHGLVLRLCGSSHWHVRDMAARTYSGLIPDSELAQTINDVLPSHSMGQNTVHGRLLCIKYVLKYRLRQNSRQFRDICSAIKLKSPDLFDQNSCPFTASMYLDILEILECDIKTPIREVSSISRPPVLLLRELRASYSSATTLGPSLTGSTVLRWSRIMEEVLGNPEWRLDAIEELDYIISVLRSLLHDPRPFDLRYAAASSLKSMPSIWNVARSDHARISNIQLLAVVLAYDMLNDDDDEIREIGSSVASKFLDKGENVPNVRCFAPLVSSQQIAIYLVKNHSQSPTLAQHSSERMTGSMFDKRVPSLHPPVSQRLEDAVQEDTALFTIEKQNLYIDEVREAVLWSDVTKRLSPEALPTPMAASVAEWTLAGLEVLVKKMEEDDDKALGWCSKPDVFIIIMEVLCAADVSLCWQYRNGKSKIVEMLVRLLDLGLKSGMHEMLVQKIEKILLDSVTRRVSIASGKVHAIETSLA